MSKISDVTANDVAEYLRLDTIELEEIDQLNNYIESAKKYISNYTGLTIEQMDEQDDLTFVLFVLVQDMWDNRSLYVKTTNLNKTVESILNMHRTNML